MILTIRYSHVRDLVKYYAIEMADDKVLQILDQGLHTKADAEHLSYFVWKMIDEISKDRERKKIVLGGTDNSSMLPDVSYELDVLMSDSGFSDIWEKISDQA